MGMTMSTTSTTGARDKAAARFNKRRSDEGDDLERYAVPFVLERDGYDPESAALGRSHLSRGAFDWIGVKPGELIVVSSRLTRVGSLSPELRHAEAAALWRLVGLLTVPGLTVRAIIGTAEHAPTRKRDGSWGPCRCQPRVPVEELLDADGDPLVRFLQMTAAPKAGRGTRPSWEPWTPDFARVAGAGRAA